MRYQEAKKLHNEDEVIVKATGAVTTVIDTEIDDKNKIVTVNCDYDGYTPFKHTEITGNIPTEDDIER